MTNKDGQHILTMGYGVIPKLVMKDLDLTIEAKAIYAYIASYAGAGSTAYPSVELICHDLRIGKDRFQKHKRMLLEKGYLVIEQTVVRGQYANNLYVLSQTVTELKETEEEATDEEQPLPDFTAMEDQTVENPAQGNQASNKNSINNNNLNNNNPKDLLEEDDDTILNLYKPGNQEGFAYWQKKWHEHYGTQPAFTLQIHKGLEQWVELFGDPEVVEHAFTRAGRYGGRSFAYLDCILRNWWEEGVRTIEEVYDREIAERG